MKRCIRHYMVAMQLVKLECDEEFSIEEGIASLRENYPTEVISFVHPSKVCLFT